jgi:hypothetical protein
MSGVSGFVSVKVSESASAVSAQGIEIIFPDGKKILFHHPVEALYLKSLLS